MKRICFLLLVLLALVGCQNPSVSNLGSTVPHALPDATSPEVVDVFIVAGQSNAFGSGSEPTLAPSVDGNILQTYGPGYWIPGQEVNPMTPVGLMPAFAKAYHDKTGRTAWMIQTATPGAYLITWPGVTADKTFAPDGHARESMKTIIRAALASLLESGKVPNVKGVIWAQGESDAFFFMLGYPEVLYEYGFIGLEFEINNLLGAVNTPWYIVQTGNMSAFGVDTSYVRTAQTNLATTYGNIFTGYTNTINFGVLGWLRTDGIHYNQAGLNDIGTAIGNMIE